MKNTKKNKFIYFFYIIVSFKNFTLLIAEKLVINEIITNLLNLLINF